MKINKFTIFKKVGDIDSNYVLEAENRYNAAQASAAGGQKKSAKFLDWLTHGWGVAIICLLVSGGVVGGIIYAGQNPPLGPPVATVEPQESEVETNTEESKDIESILAKAPDWVLPEEGSIISQSAFVMCYRNSAGEVVDAVLRTAIFATAKDTNTRYYLYDLLDDNGAILSSNTQQLPNVNGRVLFFAADAERDKGYRYEGVDLLCVMGIQVNHITEPLTDKNTAVPNIVIDPHCYYWNEMPGLDGKQFTWPIQLRIRCDEGRNSEWDVDFVRALKESVYMYGFNVSMEQIREQLDAVRDRVMIIADFDQCYTPQTGNTVNETEYEKMVNVTPEDLYAFYHTVYGNGTVPPLDFGPEEFTWTFEGQTLTGFVGGEPPEELVMPSETPDGLPVTKIGRNCLSGGQNVRRVVIPDTVTSIEDYAFSHCDNLEEIIFPSQLQSIGTYAFYHVKMKEIILPQSCQSIDSYAFAEIECEYVELWAERIPNDVFELAEIENLVLREGVKRIDNQPNLSVNNCYLPRSIEYMYEDFVYGKFYFQGTEAEWESKNYHFEDEMIFEADYNDLKP